jgi:ParB family chromosome partitioning protein
MGKIDKLKQELGANVEESTGGPGTESAPAPALAKGPASKPARLVGVERPRDTALIELDRIVPDPDQPRKEFDPDELGELVESLRQDGQLQPIRVRWVEELAKYMVIMGERRFIAAGMAGLKSLACVIEDRKLMPQEILRLQVIENAVRSDLKPIEKANAIQRLMEEFGFSQAQVGAELKMSQPAVAKSLALLKLAPEIQEQVESGEIAAQTAAQIARVESAEEQREVADQVVAEGLSETETAEVVREKKARKPRGTSPGSGKGRGGKPKLEKSRVFNFSGIKILAESRKGLEPSGLLAALREASARVESELQPTG